MLLSSDASKMQKAELSQLKFNTPLKAWNLSTTD